MINRLRSLRFGPWTASLALLALCALAYLPMIYRLGFYWDDWPSVWFYHFLGPEGFQQGFSSDRPLLAWIFKLTTPLMGESTQAWQYFSIFTRWLTSLAWWWTLRGLWPDRPREVFWAAALFAVYPGFSQQYIAVTYSNAYLVFFLFVLSLGTMIWAQRLHRWFWPLMALSVACSAISMLITEYFLGLELLRPFFIWLTIDDYSLPLRQKIRYTMLRWAPYLALLIPFLIWRAFFNTSPRAQILLFGDLLKAPFATIFRLTRTIFQDFWEVNILAWFHDLDPGYLKEFDPNVITLLIGAVAASLFITLVYLLLIKRQPPAANIQPRLSWSMQAISLGVLTFLVSGWTIWITDLHFELLFPFDRFTLITMLGTSLLVAGLIGLADRRAWITAGTVAILVALSTGIQFQHRLYYRQEWLSQKNFFWQLTWRAPGIEPGTLLMTSEIPFTYFSDNSLSAPLNWIYSPKSLTSEMPYLLYDIEARLGIDLKEIKPGEAIQMPYRASGFKGSTSKAIVLFYDPPRCLKVMDPELDRFLPVKPLYIREATSLSRPELIQSNPVEPAKFPTEIFGPEPAPNWCYYFEKAELFAQAGDWQGVEEMADKALKINKHFTDKNVSELIPFVMGYAHVGKWAKAVELSMSAYQIWDKTQYPLCDAWQSLRGRDPRQRRKNRGVKQIQEVLSCQFP